MMRLKKIKLRNQRRRIMKNKTFICDWCRQERSGRSGFHLGEPVCSRCRKLFLVIDVNIKEEENVKQRQSR